jgi:hypothetical protein
VEEEYILDGLNVPKSGQVRRVVIDIENWLIGARYPVDVPLVTTSHRGTH